MASYAPINNINVLMEVPAVKCHLERTVAARLRMLYVAATTYTAARRGTHVTSKEVCVVTSKECMCCRV